MPDWSIKIIPAENGGAAFVPDLRGAKPSDSLLAQDSDLVTWNNTTNDHHQPWQTDGQFKLLPNGALSKEILPQRSSSPAYNLPPPPTGAPVTIYYCCKLHPHEHGTIEVAAIPNWTVNIIPCGVEGAAFVPNIEGKQPGDPLQVTAGDLVAWINTTDESHQPWQTDENFNALPDAALVDEIPPHTLPRSCYKTPPTQKGGPDVTIYYRCNAHPDDPHEHGTLIVKAPG